MIGQPVRRSEDPPLVTGRGCYAGDVRPEGLLHMAVVRSPVAHGDLRTIDLGPALALPGVAGAFTAADLPEAGLMADLRQPGPGHVPRPVLAQGRVRYVGEPVAVVVAADPYVAADAADAVGLDIEPLPAVGDVLGATAPGAPQVHGEAEGNVAAVVRRGFGDADSALASAPVVIEARLRLARVAGGYLEPRAATAWWAAAHGSLTLHSSTQTVYAVRGRVAALLGLEAGSVHVLAPDVGGAFGAKGMPYSEEVLVSALARRLGRPVRWVATRSEDTSATAHGHGTVLDLALAASSDGTLRGLRARILHDIGAYAGPGAEQADNIVGHMVCAYRLPALDAELRATYTNAVPSGYIRGGGREIGNFAIERMLDLMARRLGISPIELRRRNLIGPLEMPYDTGYPRGDATVVYDGGDYPALLDAAVLAIGKAGPGQGVGVACCVEATGIGNAEPARARVDANGDVTAYMGSTPQGQGHRTILAQVVAERLGWPFERVRVVVGDTTAVPNAYNSAASRTAYEVGNAAAVAAIALGERLRVLAAERLEADVADVLVGPEGAWVQGAPAVVVPLADLVGAEGVEVFERFESSRAFASSCHAALVDVDALTGEVRVVRYVIAHDSGRSINPRLVEGQLHGGYAHGLGYALFEEAVYDPDGAFRSASFLDYAIPSVGEVGAGPLLHEVHSAVYGVNPEGFKGVGEAGTIAAPAAVAAAVDDALRRPGGDVFASELPLTSERVRALASGQT